MSKKLTVIMSAVVLTLALATTATAFAFARNPAMPNNAPCVAGNGDYDYMQQCFTLMYDANGEIVSKDVFADNLDKAIADGVIEAADKASFLELYDTCTVDGGGNARGRGCGNMGGRGRMGGCPMTSN